MSERQPYQCQSCGKQLMVESWADLKVCPFCETGKLERDTIFDRADREYDEWRDRA